MFAELNNKTIKSTSENSTPKSGPFNEPDYIK
jgi:hypothetical protein